jgi:hypothetical protein
VRPTVTIRSEDFVLADFFGICDALQNGLDRRGRSYAQTEQRGN